MKKITLICLFLFFVFSLSAQNREQDGVNPDILRFKYRDTRTHINIPDVNGYHVYKSDLHVHTYYSDGDMSPEYRILEAFRDGLDIIAITDHIEYRPLERGFVEYLAGNVVSKYPDDSRTDIRSDLNYSVKLAQNVAKRYGIKIIKGIEITQNAKTIGHFNVLFTKDNNLIVSPAAIDEIRNAKKQGAIVQNNHPGWARSDANLTDVARQVIAEGLLNGIEVINDTEFYPKSIEDATEANCYICAGSDLHGATYDKWGSQGHFRNMTLIMAKDTSEASLKEAFLSRRTLAYGYGDIAGEEKLLASLFNACVRIEFVSADSKGVHVVRITNSSSLPFILSLPGESVDVKLEGNATIICSLLISTCDSGRVLEFDVKNMWYGVNRHPHFKIAL